jgi:hypothetical protein
MDAIGLGQRVNLCSKPIPFDRFEDVDGLMTVLRDGVTFRVAFANALGSTVLNGVPKLTNEVTLGHPALGRLKRRT